MPNEITVILPTHARFKSGLLEKSIESVCNQTFPNWKLVVIDDGSYDGTAEFLQEFSKRDDRITHMRLEANVGQPALTMAKAFVNTSSPYIAFNFDDTILKPKCLEILYDSFEKQPNIDMAYGDMLMHMPNGKARFGNEPSIDLLIQGNFIGQASVLIKREAFYKIGWFDPNLILKRCCDWDLWLRAFRVLEVAYVPEILSEEFAQEQTDSFRRSIYNFRDLVQQYMASDRNKALDPDLVAAGKVSIDEPFCELDCINQYNYSRACLEHFVRTIDLNRIKKHFKQILENPQDSNCLRINKMSCSPKTDPFIKLSSLFH